MSDNLFPSRQNHENREYYDSLIRACEKRIVELETARLAGRIGTAYAQEEMDFERDEIERYKKHRPW